MNRRSHVLRYSYAGVGQTTVKPHYQKWRREQALPNRCDNPECQFCSGPLLWNGKPLTLILDHVDGVCRDNRPEKLRFLCPNCDSQLQTRGGANRGQVQFRKDGFAAKRPDGGLDHALFLSDNLLLTDRQM